MLNPILLTKKAILKCPDLFKHEFNQSCCSLTISVGQDPHEGDKFKATLLTVQNHFKECIIMVCDSLQRHTLSIGSLSLNLAQVHEKANLLGELWLERNLPFIQQIGIPYTIIRWDYWLTHPNYQKAKEKVEVLYAADSAFYQCIENTAHAFLERNDRKFINTASQNKILDVSREYLKEECAVMLLWVECNFQFEIYPSQRNAAMDYIHKNILAISHPSLIRDISIKFKNLSITSIYEPVGELEVI